jgi:hypothetical protein
MHLVNFLIRKFITIHGHMNAKKMHMTSKLKDFSIVLKILYTLYISEATAFFQVLLITSDVLQRSLVCIFKWTQH